MGLALLLQLAGCALTASKADYRAYRATRTAGDDTARLVAMRAYLQAHPDGVWAAEVDRDRRRRDTASFEAGKDSRAGLQLYLRVFPDGAFAAQARERLRAIDVIEAGRARQAEQAEQAARARAAREEMLRRTWVSRFVAYWARTFAGLRGWGAPVARVAGDNPDFSRAFGRSPRPRCSEQECLKYHDARYAIRVPGGTRIERQMRLVLRLRMAEGGLAAAELLLPARGFSRWFEQETGQTVPEGDPGRRAEAVAWAMARIAEMLGALPGELTSLGSRDAPTIAAPGIAPTGELLDTSVEDPSAPPNRIAGARDPDEAAGQQDAAPAQAAPDMVLGGLDIGADGETRTLPGSDAAESAAGEGQPMVLDALTIPAEGGTPPANVPGGPPPQDAAPAVGPAPSTVRAEAYRIGGLEVIVFAGARGPGGGYDGLLLGPVTAHPQAPRPGR